MPRTGVEAAGGWEGDGSPTDRRGNCRWEWALSSPLKGPHPLSSLLTFRGLASVSSRRDARGAVERDSGERRPPERAIGDQESVRQSTRRKFQSPEESGTHVRVPRVHTRGGQTEQ